MNKMLIASIAIYLGILLGVDSSIYAYAVTDHSPEFAYAEATDDVLEERLHNLYSEVDARLTSDVKKYIRQYTVQYRNSAEEILGRASLYFPLFEEKLRNEGIPDEIKALAIVESRLNPEAVSPHGATGLWQFIKSTGQVYDLQQSKYIDERRNPEKSTAAAAEFLNDLYKRYGDWTLALAAYNCGPGNVNKAMRKSGKSDYWSIRQFLPKETQQYIPKFIAVNYLINYYYAHDLVPNQPSHNLSDIATAKVFKSISFKKIEQTLGIDIEYIKELNPQYIRHHIPTNDGRYLLKLPLKDLLEIAESEMTELEIETFYEVPVLNDHISDPVELMTIDKQPINDAIVIKKLQVKSQDLSVLVSDSNTFTPVNIRSTDAGEKNILKDDYDVQITATNYPHKIKRVSFK